MILADLLLARDVSTSSLSLLFLQASMIFNWASGLSAFHSFCSATKYFVLALPCLSSCRRDRQWQKLPSVLGQLEYLPFKACTCSWESTPCEYCGMHRYSPPWSSHSPHPSLHGHFTRHHVLLDALNHLLLVSIWQDIIAAHLELCGLVF